MGIEATGRHCVARLSFWTRSATFSSAAAATAPTPIDSNKPIANFRIMKIALNIAGDVVLKRRASRGHRTSDGG
jgi:hypothetical protein